MPAGACSAVRKPTNPTLDARPVAEAKNLDIDISRVVDESIAGRYTRVMAPLLPATASVKVVRRLNPAFVIDGKPYVMFTHLIAIVAVSRLPEPRTNFLLHQDEIVASLDMLFQGF
jgi:toxin CcdB